MSGLKAVMSRGYGKGLKYSQTSGGKYAMSNRYKFISTNKRIYRITDHWHQGVAATVA